MKRKSIHPILKAFDSCMHDLKDYTKSKKVTIFFASGNKKLKQGDIAFEFDYEPIFEENEYLRLLNYYENSTTLINIYDLMCYKYFTIYFICIKWYIEKSKVTEILNIKEVIHNYEIKTVDEFSCPILKCLDLTLLNNDNFFGNIKSIMSKVEIEDITSLDILLYGTEKFDLINLPIPTKEGKLLLNSVVNIAYKRFLNFLLREEKAINKNRGYKPTCLKDIFSKEETKIGIIQDAIRDLNINKILGERQITGFIDGCKKAGALPDSNTTDLLRVIYFEIDKEVLSNTKPRYDKESYSVFLKNTMKYFNI